MTTKHKATIDDLYNVSDNAKAEIINGEIVLMSPTGGVPNYAAGEIFASLREYGKRTKKGKAVSDNAGFKVKLKNRDSLSPDAAFYIGQNPGMKFFDIAPIFAVEVRSENDYGDEAEKAIIKKRNDYFLAGTEVYWDVDLLSNDVIKKYLKSDPNNPIIYHKGEIADAEPILNGWAFEVNDLFWEED